MYNNLMDLVIVAPTLKVVRYIENILEEHVVIPAVIGEGLVFLFVQDNATARSVTIIRDIQKMNEFGVNKWPGISPDVNPIEELLDVLGRNVRNRRKAPETLQELGYSLK